MNKKFFVYEEWKIQEACLKNLCRITVQSLLMQSKLEHPYFFTISIILFSLSSFSSIQLILSPLVKLLTEYDATLKHETTNVYQH